MAGRDIGASADIGQADWIGDALSAFGDGVVTSVIPAGFEAYTRLLHPLDVRECGRRPARWRDVAAWSGVDLAPGVGFAEIAMPEKEPSGPEPWPGQTPQIGTLDPIDLEGLLSVLTGPTSTLDYGW